MRRMTSVMGRRCTRSRCRMGRSRRLSRARTSPAVARPSLQEQCPRHTGDRLEHGRYEDLQLGELRECLEQSEDTEGSNDRNAGGDEDDGAEDDDEVEDVPAL